MRNDVYKSLKLNNKIYILYKTQDEFEVFYKT